MQRFGKVTLAKNNTQYYCVWAEDKSGMERLDVLEDLSQYNMLDTSNCIAAYYKKSKEMFLGDEELIRTILKARSAVSLFNAKKVDKVEIKDGKSYITSTKVDEDLGYKWECVLENGLPFSEYYQTPDVIVDITSMQRTAVTNIEPINKIDYIIYNVMDESVHNAINDAEYHSEEYLRAVHPIDHIDENDFVVVESYDQAVQRLQIFRDAPTKIKSVDIETTGTQTGIYGPDVITGVSLSWLETESTYYPFRQENCQYNLPISFLRDILDAINNQPKDVIIVSFNGKFEIQGFWKESKHYIANSEYARMWDPDCAEHGLENTHLRIDADAFFLSILANPVFKQKGVHTLKAEAYRADGKVYLELDQIFLDKKNIRFNVLPPGIIKLYACPDTPNTIKVYKNLLKKIPKGTQGIFALENKMIYVTAENEFFGLRCNQQGLLALIENEEYKVKTLGDYFKKIHHTNKNINSPEVRRDIFYNKLRCPIEVKTNKGLPSTSNVALQRIIELGTVREYDKTKEHKAIVDLRGAVVVKGEDLASNRFPSLVVLGAYAKAQKLLGAYQRLLRTSINGRIMFYMNQYGAATGRRTSDAHQYSDGMKSLVLADSAHHHLWSADFKQIELRLLAYLSGQKDLIKMMCNQNTDIHRAITSIITGQPIWSISAKERSRRKATNFGVVYMMSAYGLAKNNKGPAYTTEDYYEALKSINDFYLGLPQINKFVKGNEDFVREKGYMQTKFGRIREFHEILDPTYPEKKKTSMVRAANNMPVQGFGADLLKIVELDLKDYIKSKGWDELVDCDGVMLPKVRLMLSIHDEVLVSSHESIPIAEIITMFKICMEQRVEGAPPFFAAPALIDNWYEGKLDKYELDLDFRDEIVAAYEKDGTELITADNYLDTLLAYRSQKLSAYMERLIAEHHTVEEVANNVRDDELTHTLIAVYIKKGEKFEHLDAIYEATKRYMETRDVSADAILQAAEDKAKDVLEDRQILQSFEELEEFVTFDENGEAIFEESEEDDDDLSTVTEKSLFAGTVERTRAIYSLNQVFIDLNEYKVQDEVVRQVYEKMIDLYVPDGAYQVYFMIGGAIRGLDCYMNYEPVKIDQLINSIIDAA